MQQVARSIRERRKRDRLRNNLQHITPQQYSNSVRYYQDPVVPHQVLKHNFQHLKQYAYNQNQQISARQIYTISEALVYEPLRYYQLQVERQRSKSLQEGNEFLSNYNHKDHEKKREEYFSRIKIIQMARKEEQNERINEFHQKEQEKKRKTEKDKMRLLHVLPPINPKISRKRTRKFRSAGIAILFITILKKRLKIRILNRKKLCQQQHKAYVKAAMESVQAFYYIKLQEQIAEYVLVLENHLKNPQQQKDLYLLVILNSFFKKVNALPLPTAIIQALAILCCNYSAFPTPFLHIQQLRRLPYLTQYGCLGTLSQDQSSMIAACFLVIKIFCFNLFYRPWLTKNLSIKREENQVNLRFKYWEVRRIINRMGSLPYFIVMDNFLLKCPIVHSLSSIDQLNKEGIEIILPSMQVVPKQASKVEHSVNESSDQEPQKKSEKLATSMEKETELAQELKDEIGLILGQNRAFYARMWQQREQEMKSLEHSISQWVRMVTIYVRQLFLQSQRVRVKDFLS